MPRFCQPYAEFLRTPTVAGLFAIAAIARLPVSMLALALTLYLRETLGDFARAGTVVGAYFIAMAVMAPVLGRLIDRIGPRVPLLVTGSIQPLLLLGVYIAAAAQWGFPVVMVAAIAAGLVPTPIAILTRTLWRHRFVEENQRRLAYALDSVITELNFTLGPAMVGLLAALVSPTVALLVSIAAQFCGFLLFINSAALASWKQQSGGQRHWLGPLRDGVLVCYFVLGFGLTFCLGLFEVGYPAYALAKSTPMLAGVLLALNGFGSALGGMLSGLWQSRSVERQYTLMLALLVVPFVLHATLSAKPVFIVVAFVGGFAVAPALTALTLLTTRRAPVLYATEAMTWSATFIISGLGAGMAAAGVIIERHSLTVMFWCGAVVVGCMAMWGWSLQRESAPNS